MMFHMKKNESLKERLIKAVLATTTVTWLLGAIFSVIISKHQTDNLLDSALQEVAQRILPLAFVELLDPERKNQQLEKIAAMPPVGPHQERITYIVRDAAGQVRLQSHDADLNAFPENPEIGFADGPQGRIYTEAAAQGSVRVTVAEAPGLRTNALISSISTLIVAIAASLILALLAIRVVVAAALGPVEKFRQAIESRDERHLDPVDISRLPAELASGADAVNKLMERLNKSLNAERQFVARAAHELRTPIAATLAQIQLLRREISAEVLSDRINIIESSLKRLAGLSTKLLEAAKAESAHAFGEKPIDLRSILNLVIEEVELKQKKSRIQIDEASNFLSLVDADAAAIVIRNLIENAIKHGTTDEPIRVSLDPTGIFSVINRGAIIVSDDQDRLLRPFQRSSTGGDGVGLGLAIVNSFAAAFKTRLEIISPAPGLADGCQIKLRFPSSMPKT